MRNAQTRGRTSLHTQCSTRPAPKMLNSTHIILPCMQLPQFRGRYEDWPGFSDQFRTTVHDNPRLIDCQKLTYLRACLPGEAAKSIELFANAPANYFRAWELPSRLYNKQPQSPQPTSMPYSLCSRYLEAAIVSFVVFSLNSKHTTALCNH